MLKKILLVDDDQINLKLMQKHLEQDGYQVILAIDGEAGMQRAVHDHPDLIVLDVEMPKMDGYQFMGEYNRNPDLSSIPVVVLTAHEEMQPIFNLKGVKDYLIKPIDPEFFRKKIGQQLS